MDPPSLAGAAHTTVSISSPDVTELTAGAPGTVFGVPETDSDQLLKSLDSSPYLFLPRTWTWYQRPLTRRSTVYSRGLVPVMFRRYSQSSLSGST